MEVNIKDNGKMEKLMEMVNLNFQMVKYILEIGKII